MPNHCTDHSGMLEKIEALNKTVNTWGKALCVVIPLSAGLCGGIFAYIGIPALTSTSKLETKIAEELAKRDLQDKDIIIKINDHSGRLSRLESSL